MATDEIIKITFGLDTGDVASKAADAGKQSATAFEAGFKPKIDIVPIPTSQTAAKVAYSYADAIRKLLTPEIEKSFFDIDFAKTGFGKNIHEAVRKAAETAPPTPAALPAIDPRATAETIAHGMKPVVAGLEAFTALLKGAPLGAAAALAVQGFAPERERGRGGIPIAPPLGGAAHETEAQRIERRLAAIPGAVPPEPSGVGGGLKAAGAGAAAGAVFGGPGSIIGGAIGGALGFATPVPGATAAGIATGIVIGKAAEDVTKSIFGAGEAVEDMAEKASRLDIELLNMAKTLNTTPAQLLRMRHEVAATGGDFDSWGLSLQRLAVHAKQQMPEIERQVELSSDVITESNIKVAESTRGVAKARDDEQAGIERVAKTRGELEKFEATRAQEREQQARAAALAVTGAQIGLRGAQMQRAQAGIGLAFAPQEARQADIAGPLTVEGARLGRRGAGIALEEAQARWRRFDTGEEEDPDVVEQRQRRKEILAVQTARHNFEDKKLAEDKAETAEQKRVTMRGAGLGPEAQAQQQADQAAQAEDQAKLHLERVTTAQTGLKILQETNTLQMEGNELQRQLNEALRNQLTGPEAVQRAEAKLRKDIQEQKKVPYGDVLTVQSAIEAFQRGEPVPGFKFEQVEPGALRGALFRMGGGRASDIVERLSEYIRGPAGEDQAEQLRAIAEVIPGRRGERQRMQMLDYLKLSPEERAGLSTPKDIERFQQLESTMLGREPAARGYLAQQGIRALDEQMRGMVTGLEGINVGGKVSAFGEAVDQITDAAKRVGINIPDYLATAQGAIKGAADALHDAVASKAGEIKAIVIGPPTPTPAPTPTPTPAERIKGGFEAIEQQTGGLISGPGSETSDSIPIRASHGEFIIKAERTRALGVSFLNALNEGKLDFAKGGIIPRFQGGGPVVRTVRPPGDDEYWKWVEASGIRPNRAEWNEVKAAGLDPNTSFDADGSLSPEAAAKIKTHKAAAPKPTTTTQAAAAARAVTPITPVGAGIRFAPGAQPEAQLSDEQVRDRLKDRGFNVPKDATIVRNPFFPDDSFQIRLPNRGPVILIPPTTDPTRPTTDFPSRPPGPPSKRDLSIPFKVSPRDLATPQEPVTKPTLIPSSTLSIPVERKPGESKADFDERVQRWYEERDRAAQQRGDAVKDATGKVIPLEKQTTHTGFSLLSPAEIRKQLEQTAEGRKTLKEIAPEEIPLPQSRPQEAGLGELPFPRPRPKEAGPREPIPEPQKRVMPLPEAATIESIVEHLKTLVPKEEPQRKPTMEELREQLIEPSTPEQRKIDPNLFRGERTPDVQLAMKREEEERERRRREEQETEAAAGGLVQRLQEGGPVYGYDFPGEVDRRVET